MRWGTFDLWPDPWIWLKVTSMASTAPNRKSAKNTKNSGFLMIHSTLRDQDWSFYCQINGNIMLSKCFDDMRLLRPLRPMRSLRLLRFLMAGKSPSKQLLIFWGQRSCWDHWGKCHYHVCWGHRGHWGFQNQFSPWNE